MIDAPVFPDEPNVKKVPTLEESLPIVLAGMAIYSTAQNLRSRFFELLQRERDIVSEGSNPEIDAIFEGQQERGRRRFPEEYRDAVAVVANYLRANGKTGDLKEFATILQTSNANLSNWRRALANKISKLNGSDTALTPDQRCVEQKPTLADTEDPPITEEMGSADQDTSVESSETEDLSIQRHTLDTLAERIALLEQQIRELLEANTDQPTLRTASRLVDSPHTRDDLPQYDTAEPPLNVARPTNGATTTHEGIATASQPSDSVEPEEQPEPTDTPPQPETVDTPEPDTEAIEVFASSVADLLPLADQLELPQLRNAIEFLRMICARHVNAVPTESTCEFSADNTEAWLELIEMTEAFLEFAHSTNHPSLIVLVEELNAYITQQHALYLSTLEPQSEDIEPDLEPTAEAKPASPILTDEELQHGSAVDEVATKEPAYVEESNEEQVGADFLELTEATADEEPPVPEPLIEEPSTVVPADVEPEVHEPLSHTTAEPVPQAPVRPEPSRNRGQVRNLGSGSSRRRNAGRKLGRDADHQLGRDATEVASLSSVEKKRRRRIMNALVQLGYPATNFYDQIHAACRHYVFKNLLANILRTLEMSGYQRSVLREYGYEVIERELQLYQPPPAKFASIEADIDLDKALIQAHLEAKLTQVPASAWADPAKIREMSVYDLLQIMGVPVGTDEEMLDNAVEKFQTELLSIAEKIARQYRLDRATLVEQALPILRTAIAHYDTSSNMRLREYIRFIMKEPLESLAQEMAQEG